MGVGLPPFIEDWRLVQGRRAWEEKAKLFSFQRFPQIQAQATSAQGQKKHPMAITICVHVFVRMRNVILCMSFSGDVGSPASEFWSSNWEKKQNKFCLFKSHRDGSYSYELPTIWASFLANTKVIMHNIWKCWVNSVKIFDWSQP